MRNGYPIGAAILAIILPMILRGAPARADDIPPAPRPAPSWDWTGFYAGGHVGALTGTTTFSDPNGVGLFGGSVVSRGFLAGLQAGYNWQATAQVVLGIEADASLMSGNGSNTCLQSSVIITGSNCKLTPREIATLTGRLGFVTEPHGRTLIYGKAGAAWMRADASMNPNHAVDVQDPSYTWLTFSDVPGPAVPSSASISAWGATVGAGVEYAIGSSWSLKMEYNYLRFNGMSLTTPPTSSVTPSSVTPNAEVTNLPSSGSSSISQDFHIARLGLNYHFGGGARPSQDGGAAARDAGEAPWTPGWEFEAGARYWYSSGSYQNSNGGPNVLISRLSYNNMAGHSGEMFGRVDTPIDLFVKGLVGVGVISQGQMYDEDWGISNAISNGFPLGYTASQSNIWGSLNYATVDLGYNLLRGPDHKVGVFVGYNLYQTIANAMGCAQIVQPTLGNCTYSQTTYVISQYDTWQSIRLGVSAEARIFDRVKLSGDVAYLPYVAYSGLDAHWQRVPPLFFPFNGTGNGVQAELIATYDLTKAFSLGLGGRYWAMWTNLGSQIDSPGNLINASTDRYGMFLQASYKFNVPK